MNFGSEFVVQNSMDESGKLDWTQLLQYIAGRESSQNPHRPEDIETLREVLLDALLEKGCDDEGIVIRLFEFYARYLDVVWWRNSVSFERIVRFDSSRGTLWRRISVTPATVSWILTPLTSTASSPRHVSSRTECSFVYGTPGVEETEWTAMNACDWKFFSALVKYGYFKGLVDSRERTDFFELWLYIQLHTRPEQAIPYLEQLGKGLFIWNNLRNPDQLAPLPRGCQRVRLIVRTLKAAALHGEGDPTAESYVRCLKVYFATLTEPMVSVDEVREFLLYVLFDKDSRRAVDVDRLVDQWVDLFGQQPYGPRSLAHLCRCLVRNALVKNKSAVVPGLVEFLPIPRALKDFVLGYPE